MQEVNESNFEKEVLKSDKLVVVDNFALWCQPCLAMAPIFDELSKEMKNIKFVKLNVDENNEISSKYNIMSIPTFLIFNNGKEVNRHIGMIKKDELKKKINSFI